MKRFAACLFALVLASLACSQEIKSAPISLTPAQEIATLTPVSPVLTVEQLRNATFNVMGSDQILRTVTLKDGKSQIGTDPAQLGYVSISLGEKIAFGDLNADALADAAISLAENYGGSGVFVSVVAILNQGGQPNPIATILIDDRPMINDLFIKNGEILVDATIHDTNDAMCCPSLPSTRNYRLIENKLVLSRYTTKTPNGAERVITITSPANGAEISGAFVIKGNVTISPFENNLVYSVFLPGTQDPVDQSGFTITANVPGGPGTFELPLDFGTAGFKGPARIEITELSPADGSYLALNTLFVTLK